jgi:DNA-binding NtrC family response regulator
MATILIVDDDNLVRDTLRDLLSLSHECHTADRAEQALAYLEVERYDVVLTDISMPGLSGRELLRYIQAKHTMTPVIVISGMSNEEDARDILNAGAFAYFAKPFKLDEIEEAVERAIQRHWELNPDAALPEITDDDEPEEVVTVLEDATLDDEE